MMEPDERDCENKLVLLLDYDKFELIKLLLKHRWKISVCTRLAQAQSEEEKASMLAEMAAVPQAVEVRGGLIDEGWGQEGGALLTRAGGRGRSGQSAQEGVLAGYGARAADRRG